MDMRQSTERYYSGNLERDIYNTSSDEGAALFAELKKQFDWVKINDYFYISTKSFHEILGEDVVTCGVINSQTTFLAGADAVCSARKFCLGSNTSFLRVYRVYTGEKPSWLPPSAKVMFIGENHEEYGRKASGQIDKFHDLYIQAEPEEMEKAFNLPERRGTYETYYGITVVNGEPRRVKQYVYDDQTGFSDWDVIYFMRTKRI